MDKSVEPVAERNVFKRTLRLDEKESELAVKKPALVNPLQDANSNVNQSEETANHRKE